MLPDGREVRFTYTATYNEVTQRVDQQPFVFVGVREEQLQGGHELVGWCSDADCPDAAAHAAAVVSCTGFSAVTSTEVFGQGEGRKICRTAQQVLDANVHWNSHEMQKICAIRDSDSWPQQMRQRSFLDEGRPAQTVQPQPIHFIEWG